MNKNYKKILEKIKKHYKNKQLFLEIYMENYEGYFLYFRIDYFKKLKSYKLSWFDLELVNIKDIESSVSYESLTNETIDYLKNLFSEISVEQKLDLYDTSKLNSKVTVYAKIEENDFHCTFYKFIPTSLPKLSEIFVVIFNNLPKKLEVFLPELHAEFSGETEKYEYRSKFTFDLFNDNIDELFKPEIIKRGKKYYEENRVTFLEKINDKYIAIVEGKEPYSVTIDYDEKTKQMQVYCSCPCQFYCKHIYAVIMSIRNKNYNKFYKISYKNPNVDLLQRIMEFDFLLCLGIYESYFVILTNNCEVQLIPILDENKKNNWEIIEDNNGQLEKQLNNYLKK